MLRAANTTAESEMLPRVEERRCGMSQSWRAGGGEAQEGTRCYAMYMYCYTSDEGVGGDRPAYFVAVGRGRMRLVVAPHCFGREPSAFGLSPAAPRRRNAVAVAEWTTGQLVLSAPFSDHAIPDWSPRIAAPPSVSESQSHSAPVDPPSECRSGAGRHSPACRCSTRPSPCDVGAPAGLKTAQVWCLPIVQRRPLPPCRLSRSATRGKSILAQTFWKNICFRQLSRAIPAGEIIRSLVGKLRASNHPESIPMPRTRPAEGYVHVQVQYTCSVHTRP
jgi:hypothetical protein